MPRMTPLEMKLWKDRLTFADSCWKDWGCTGESVDGRATINLFAEGYRGNHWGGRSWGGLSARELVTVNLMFSSTNTLIAGLSARAAKPIVKPKGQGLADDEASRKAALNEVLLGSVANDLKYKRQVDHATLKAALFPAGFVRYGYTPRAEKYAPDGTLLNPYDKALPDFPFIREVGIQSIRIDPLATSLHSDEDARWCCFDDLLLEEEVRQNPGFINRKDLRATAILADDKTKPMTLQREGGPDERKLVLVRTVYDKVERKWFCLTPSCDQPLREPEDWPIPWDSLPYDALFFNANPVSIMPIALPETYWELQMELNKNRTIMSALVKRMRYAIVVNAQALGEGEADKMVDAELQEFFQTNGADVRTVAAAIKLGEFPRELLEYDARIRQDMYDVIGVDNMARGQSENIRTAAEVQGVAAGGGVLRGRSQEKVEEFWANIFRKSHKAIQVTQTSDLLVPIFDQKGASSLLSGQIQNGQVKIAPTDLQGEFHYGVQVGSTLPEQPQQELASAIALYQLFKGDTGVQQKDLRHAVLTAARRDADRMLVTAPAEMGANLNDMAMQGVGGSLAAAEKPSSGEAPNAPSQIDPNLMARLQNQVGGTQ